METDTYYLNLHTITLVQFKHIIKTSHLLPSQQTLAEELDARFTYLEDHGIQNMADLHKALKTKKSMETFAAATGLPPDYLTVLRREVNSYQPKPVNLKDFPGVSQHAVAALNEIGIKHTKHLFPRVITPAGRAILAGDTGCTPAEIYDLACLTDLARLKWVGPKFARLLVDAGYHSVAKVAVSNHKTLYQDLIQANEKTGTYKGKFGLEDMRSWVTGPVQQVPIVMEL